MSHDDVVLRSKPLGFPWETADPFLFCVHHNDAYPAGDASMGPSVSLAGREIGSDFSGKDGFSMYHGERVPGFPQHPHRGFETVTIVRSGLVDHSDSLGATARFGAGDVQWLTAGKGIVHSEMFPLVESERANPLELFQIWLNLPAKDKMVDPYFSMLWQPNIPVADIADTEGHRSRVTVIAGAFGDVRAPAPPPNSWAANSESDLAILTLRLEPNARLTLPAAKLGTNRTLYYFRGSSLQVGAHRATEKRALTLRPDAEATLVNGPEESELLLLQGRPIGEPVVAHGPFVMNTRSEIEQAFRDYQRTRFGGWPFAKDAPVHPREEGRFAKHADGRHEKA